MSDIDNFNLSNEAIIKCSKVSDPILTALAAAKTIGKDRELKAILEHTLAKWLDQQSLYELMENQDREGILEINKCLASITEEIIHYTNGEYFVEKEYKIYKEFGEGNKTYKTYKTYVYGRLIKCDKKFQATDEIKPLTFEIIDSFLTTYVNEEIHNKIYEVGNNVYNIYGKIKNESDKQGPNLFPELAEKIKLQIKKISKLLFIDELYAEFNVFGVNGDLCLKLMNYEDDLLKPIGHHHEWWNKLNFYVERYNNDLLIILKRYK